MNYGTIIVFELSTTHTRTSHASFTARTMKCRWMEVREKKAITIPMHVVDTFLFSFFSFSPSHHESWHDLLSGQINCIKYFRKKNQCSPICSNSKIHSNSVHFEMANCKCKIFTAMLVTHSRYFGIQKICMNFRYTFDLPDGRTVIRFVYLHLRLPCVCMLFFFFFSLPFIGTSKFVFGSAGRAIRLHTWTESIVIDHLLLFAT